MVARGEGCKQSHCCRHAATEGRCGDSAFERAHPVLQRFAIRVIVARVHEPARISSFDIALKRGREVNWCRDCAGCGVNLVSGMNRHCFHVNLAQVFRHACNLGSRAIRCQTFHYWRSGFQPADGCGQRRGGSTSAESGRKPNLQKQRIRFDEGPEQAQIPDFHAPFPGASTDL